MFGILIRHRCDGFNYEVVECKQKDCLEAMCTD